ncbi:hypothetical protein [Fodinicola acaciae]|uniref:hypothetical protein n=1 Tax=Fodinicola acaciae TaxID=2681555 RepID=UPI0013D894DC|nr:hypothetical protein [Fodinicola acaciae]
MVNDAARGAAMRNGILFSCLAVLWLGLALLVLDKVIGIVVTLVAAALCAVMAAVSWIRFLNR